jgi:phosphoribosylaminoimidazolecarboxamide formyltransferase/IMP cyclohydrolase
MSIAPIRRALFSTSDRTGLVEFARFLAEEGVELYGSGGTRAHLTAAGLSVIDVSLYTGFPEIMDGRVKTLHPRIHGGILCRRDRDDDMAVLREHGIVPFDLVVVNLYPFQSTVSRPGVTAAECVEMIDVGGPSLIRAAAKNHAFVAVATDPAQYAAIRREMENQQGISQDLRRDLAAAAFAHTASYDADIARWFVSSAEKERLPAAFDFRLTLAEELRYGENPHQAAGLYLAGPSLAGSLAGAKRLNGKELSYNNLLDLDSALSLVRLLPASSAAVIKHNNPCGAATAPTAAAAARQALEGDPTSAFGGIVAFNVPVDEAAARVLVEPGRFIEAIAAPEFLPAAFHVLTTVPKWKTNVRLLAVEQGPPPQSSWHFREISGGFLVQSPDDGPDSPAEWQERTGRPTDPGLTADLEFAWTVVRQVKSNAIVVAGEKTLLGVGAGQMSRVDSVNIALTKAGERARGAVLASDAFFPFPDSVELAARAGIVAIIQPGGSRNDPDVIEAARRLGLAMIFTGRRHFKH